MPMKRHKLLKLDKAKSLIPIAIAIVLIGITRQFWAVYIAELRGPLGILAIPLVLCPLVILVTLFASILIALLVLASKRTRSIIPILFFSVGTVLVFLIPLPEPPDTPEKLHFLEHRADYEAVVEMVANLQEGHNCFPLPDEFQHLDIGGCVFVEWDDYRSRGLSVRFDPIETFYHPVVYVEFDNVDNPCGWDSWVEQRIDAHWYVCEHEWN